MALEYVGGTSGVGTSTGYTISLSGTLTGGVASSPAEGDIVVVFSGFGNTASSAPNVTGNNSGAYVAATAAQHVNDTWDTEFRAFYEVMGATPDTSLTITRVTNTAYGGATVVQVWRGVDLASPFIGAATPASGTNGAALNPPAYNPSVTGAIIIAGGAGTMPAAGTAGYTSISGMSNAVAAYGNGSTADTSVIMASYDYAGASYDPAVATGGTQNNTSSSWAGVTLAIRPQSPLSATLEVTLDDATTAAAATLGLSGGLAVELESATVLATGESLSGIAGGLTATLDPATATAAAQVAIAGTASATLAAAAVSGAGQVAVNGAGSATLADATLAGLAGLRVQGAAALTLDAATGAGAGVLPVAGAVTAVLESATVSAQALLALQAQAQGTLQDASLLAGGALRLQGAGTSTLTDATLAGATALAVAGGVVVSLAPAAVTGTGVLPVSGQGAAVLDDATAVGAATLTEGGGGEPLPPLGGGAAAVLDGCVVSATGLLADPYTTVVEDRLNGPTVGSPHTQITLREWRLKHAQAANIGQRPRRSKNRRDLDVLML